MMIVKNKNIVMRTIHGTFFLINIADHYFGDQCALYEINPVGRFLWESLEECKTVEELTGKLQQAIVDEIPYDVLHRDVQEYVDVLKQKGFVTEEKGNG